jgi:hypothetical protein
MSTGRMRPAVRSKTPDAFHRFARIFHGAGNVRVVRPSGYQNATYYVVFDTAALRDEWDGTNLLTAQTAHDWQAYVDGYVYMVGVERRVIVHSVREYPDGTEETTDSEEWEETEAVWGHYGEDYARQSAREMLEAYAPATTEAGQ